MGLDPKIRARLGEKVPPPLVGINQKIERNDKNDDCICERANTAVYCKKCVEYFWGRLLNFCKEHPNVRFSKIIKNSIQFHLNNNFPYRNAI